MRIFNTVWQQQAPWLSYAQFRQSSTVRKVDQAHFALNGKIGGISEFRAMLAQQIADGLIEGPGIQGLYRFTERGWVLFQEQSQGHKA